MTMLRDLAPGALLLPAGGEVLEFLRQEHVIPGSISSMPGPFRTDSMPYLDEMLEAVGDEKVEVIVAETGSQVGKSTVIECAVHYWGQCDPDPMIIAMPDKLTRDVMVEERLRSIIYANKGFRNLLALVPDPITQARIRLKTCPIYVVMASSTPQMSQKSVRYVIGDEVDDFPGKTKGEGRPVKQLEARTRTFLNRKMLFASTIKAEEGEESEIHRLYETTDQRVWEVPCPVCEEFHVWEWEKVQFPRPEGCNLEQHRNQVEDGTAPVEYVCKHCGSVLNEKEKHGMNLKGRWRATRPQVRGRVGFHLPSLASPYTTLRGLVVEWLDALIERERTGREDDLKHFCQHQLARKYKGKRRSVEQDAIVQRQIDVERGRIPAGADLVLASADVQHDTIYWKVKAWNRREKWSHDVDWGFTATGSLEELRGVCINRVFDNAEKGGLRSAPMLVLIDSGDGSRTEEIYQFCRQFRGKRVRPCKGASGHLAGGRFVQTGKGDEHDDSLILVDTVRCKDLYANRMEKPVGVRGGCTFPMGTEEDEDFLRQMTSERRVVQLRKGGGKKVYWEAYGPNHYFDTEVYGIAAAVCMGLFQGSGRKRRQQKIEVRTGKVGWGG